jgi:hypothetical protein
MTKRNWAVSVGICCILATHTAFAIYVPLAGVKNVPFEITYPKSARQQVRDALAADNCKFITGHSQNWLSQLQFQGDTDALNEMLKRLAKCPRASLAVSFRDLNQPGDWRVDYDCRSMHFQAIVNLRSKNIALDRLAIPAAKGPELEAASP